MFLTWRNLHFFVLCLCTCCVMPDFELPALPQLIVLDASDVSGSEDTASFDLGPLVPSSDDEEEGDHDRTCTQIDFLPSAEYGFLFFFGSEVEASAMVGWVVRFVFSGSGALTSTQCSGSVPVVFTGLMEGSRAVSVLILLRRLSPCPRSTLMTWQTRSTMKTHGTTYCVHSRLLILQIFGSEFLIFFAPYF